MPKKLKLMREGLKDVTNLVNKMVKYGCDRCPRQIHLIRTERNADRVLAHLIIGKTYNKYRLKKIIR